jgi:formylglycine-generating enzyme required for sulfatase activity
MVCNDNSSGGTVLWAGQKHIALGTLGFCVFFWLLVLGGVVEAAPTVTNVRAAQRAGTKLVDVDYDLAGASGTVNAFLRVSADGGGTWTVPVTSATGAVGAVTGGTGKRITWDAGVDWNGQYTTQMRFRVLVDDLVAPTDFVTVVGGELTSSEVGVVSVGAFYVGKYEVTWGEWKVVRAWAATNGYDLAGAGGTIPSNGADNLPVVNVSWYQTVKWCNARSQMEGKTPVYLVSGAVYRTGDSVPEVDANANGYRLPLSAEWEWAARGGVQSQGYTYSGSNTIDEVAWYDTNSGFGPKAVGTKAANELGIYDMSGNVWEWCWGTKVDSGDSRPARGGSWADTASWGPPVEMGVSMGSAGGNAGFRVVLSSVP